MLELKVLGNKNLINFSEQNKTKQPPRNKSLLLNAFTEQLKIKLTSIVFLKGNFQLHFAKQNLSQGHLETYLCILIYFCCCCYAASTE